MEHDWIFDVLDDLQAYAKRNELPKLAEQIQETTLLAAVEIASRQGSEDPDEARRFRNYSKHISTTAVSAPVVS